MAPGSNDATTATTLASFITDRSKAISSEWAEFARRHLTAATKMNVDERRDHIEAMLAAIAADMSAPQTKVAQASKSTGNSDASAPIDRAANAHGTDRAATGFSPVDVVAEFRALRASVLRLWAEHDPGLGPGSLEEISRFNEAVDELLVQSMTRYAADVDHAKDIFLGVLGHDLRNPLGAIMMSATVMMTQEGPSWPHAKTAARIVNAGTRMDGLIGDLVDFTRSRLGGGIPIARARTDLEVISRQTVDEIRAFHPRSEISFQASGDLHGNWDSGRIGQAISNLLGNAVQHGTAHALIEVTATGTADAVAVSVRNQGTRIPERDLLDIFNPFKQLETPAKAHHSIGLGLYVVDAIAKAHEGTVDVESDDLGTTFTLRLPRRG
jgi:signal transduction histidine kinase